MVYQQNIETGSPTWQLVSQLAESPSGLAVAFGWGVAEAWSWPMIAEMELAFIATTRPRTTMPHALALATGSVAGVVSHAWLVRRGVRLPLPLTTPRMRETVTAQVRDDGLLGAFRAQLFSGIPVKVYAAQAAQTNEGLAQIGIAAARARVVRIVGLGLVATALSGVLQPVARRMWGPWMVTAGIAWGIGQKKVLTTWQ